MAIAGIGGISSLQAGTLTELDPLYDYAKTAPILSLKGNTEYENLDFQPLPGTNYRLVVGGNVIGTASSPAEVAALVDAANKISAQGGAAVDVRLQQEVQAATRSGEAITAFNDIYANKENNMGALETLIPLALSLMGGLALGPLIQGGAVAGTASALGAGLGTAAGSLAGNLAVGRNIEQSLISAGISGLTAGVLKGVLPAGTPGLGQISEVSLADLAKAVADGAISNATAAAVIEPIITVTAGNLTGAVLNTALTGLAQTAAVMATNPSSSNNASPRSDINTDYSSKANEAAAKAGFPDDYELISRGPLKGTVYTADGDVLTTKWFNLSTSAKANLIREAVAGTLPNTSLDALRAGVAAGAIDPATAATAQSLLTVTGGNLTGSTLNNVAQTIVGAATAGIGGTLGNNITVTDSVGGGGGNDIITVTDSVVGGGGNDTIAGIGGPGTGTGSNNITVT